MPKKTAKKTKKVSKRIVSRAKKTDVKKAAKAVSRKAGKPVKAEKPIGAVTHFYGHIKVAILKFKQPVKVGTNLRFEGATTKFVQKIVSMQFDHKPVKLAKKNQLVGIKVLKKTRPGDLVYLVK